CPLMEISQVRQGRRRPGHLDFPGTPPPKGARTMESSTPNRTAPSRTGRFHLLCADSPARQNARQWPQVVHRLETVSRIGGPVMGWLHSACASWPTRSADRYTGPWNAVTANPILLIGTRFDPTTPLANAKLAERRLGNAVLLTHDGYGHESRADPSTCVMQALGR